jgi:hypothetical protein
VADESRNSTEKRRERRTTVGDQYSQGDSDFEEYIDEDETIIEENISSQAKKNKPSE